MLINAVSLFFVVFFAQVIALSLVLGILFRQGVKKIEILFNNDLPHAIGKQMGKQVFYQERSAKGVEAKQENKKLGELDDELAKIIGPEMAGMIGFLPPEASEPLIKGIKEHPQMAKMIIKQVKKNPDQFLQQQGKPEGYTNIEFQG